MPDALFFLMVKRFSGVGLSLFIYLSHIYCDMAICRKIAAHARLLLYPY